LKPHSNTNDNKDENKSEDKESKHTQSIEKDKNAICTTNQTVNQNNQSDSFIDIAKEQEKGQENNYLNLECKSNEIDKTTNKNADTN